MLHRRSSLYYVENVTPIDFPPNEQDNRNLQAIALLQYIPIDISRWEEENRDFRWYISVPVSRAQAERINEGSYLYYFKNGEFSTGEGDIRTRRIIDRNEELYRRAEELINLNPDFPTIDNVSLLYSYHVNVGHGNLSLLVFEHNQQIHLWMVDGSTVDFRIRRNHYTEFEHCIKHITNKFHLPATPHFDVVMLTHSHYDHYSGIKDFISNGLIDSNTLFYLNLKKKVASHNFNNLLNALISHRMTIIPPFVQYSSANIEILYPNLNTFSSSLKINNTSSVYCIRFDGISYFVFPGDLETEGWDRMENTRCHPFMRQPKYYAISHHGSLNGHLRHPICPFRPIASMADCLHHSAKTVLMGRDKAFNGIYSPQVLSDFNGRLYLSEKDNLNNKAEFLEIDLISGTEIWY